jgi:hypothetical protein
MATKGGIQMKVFIGWSGDRSKTIALELRKWIPKVIQAVVPWMSETDITAGARWHNELSTQLADTDYGIVVVTPENAREPWIHFEAGALAKSVKNDAHVCPYLVDISEMTQLTGPLTEFQAKKSNKEDTLSLMQGINRAIPEGSGGLQQPMLNETFERWWPDLEKVISTLPAPVTKPPKRTDRELLEEVLDRVRSLERSSATSEQVAAGAKSLYGRLASDYFSAIRASPGSGKSYLLDQFLREDENMARRALLTAALKPLEEDLNKHSADKEDAQADPDPKKPR